MLKLKTVFVPSSLQLQSIWKSSSSGLKSSSTKSRTTTHDGNGATIDEKELEAFSRFSENWWDPKGPVGGLHSLNRIRVPFIVGDLLTRPETLENKKILDVGCGGGILSEALAKCGARVTGIDAGAEMIASATQHCKNNLELKTKPTYYCTTIEEHAKKHQNYYDKVVASEVIEHVINKDLFIKSCVLALKPGGRIFFTCPSKTRLSQLVNIFFAEYVINNPPKGTHQYDKFISPQDLGLLLETNGCKVEDIRGFALNMLTNKWKWTRTKTLFYATRAVKVK